MKLTEEQRAVVEIAEGRHLVLAPPGSGKTEMLTKRVVAALKRGVPPDKMFCVTFTVRAGVEMRERVLQWMLQGDRHSLPEGPWRDQILLLAGEPASDSSENLLRKFFRSVCGRK